MPPSGALFLEFALGDGIGYAVDSSGGIWGWGYLYGDIDIEVDFDRAPAVPVGEFVDVEVGQDDACARTEAGEVVCWNFQGEAPAEPPDGPLTAMAIVGREVCGLRPDGHLVCRHPEAFSPNSDRLRGPFSSISANRVDICALHAESARVHCIRLAEP